MDSKFILLCLGLTLLTFVVQGSEAKDDEENPADELKSGEEEDDKSEEKDEKNRGLLHSLKICHGKPWERPKSILKAVKKCDAQSKKDKDDKVEHAKSGPVCDAVCVYKNMDIITGNEYKIDAKEVEGLVEEILSGDLASGRDALKKEFKACRLEYDPDAKDNNKCKKIKPYFKCILAAVRTECAAGGGGAPVRKGGLLGGLLG